MQYRMWLRTQWAVDQLIRLTELPSVSRVNHNQCHKMQPTALVGKQVSGGEAVAVPPGALDGVTIMRYAHLYRDRVSGGVEQYLRHLDRGLLQRHRMTVLQMYLNRNGESNAIEIENVGIGRILWVPVPILQMASTLGNLPKRAGYVISQTSRQCQKEGDGRYRSALSSLRSLLRHQGRHLRYETTVLSDSLSLLLKTHKVDLLALHWLTYDADALISSALRARIPFALINHFDNKRLSLAQTQYWITQAAAIGGVSDHGVPDDLRDRYVNLSDAVDSEFFSSEKARTVERPDGPIVLVPGRIQEGKGQHDLMATARILRARNIDFVFCFAGAVDSEPLHQDLRRFAANPEMEGRILLLGEISAEELRNWYGMCSVVVLPSYSEGLPRIVLEAQAMKKPVVAYDSGGTNKAVLANETGFLVKTGDVKALADKISFLLENLTTRLRLGERGREFVSLQFSISALIQRHEAFYLNALSGTRRT